MVKWGTAGYIMQFSKNANNLCIPNNNKLLERAVALPSEAQEEVDTERNSL